MDLNQLRAALDPQTHRRDLGMLGVPGFVDTSGAVRVLDPQALNDLDDYRQPRRAYDDLFEPVD